MKFTMFDYGLIALIVMGLALLILIDTSDANAESAIVSFEDPDRIGAIKDSVIGVCDSKQVPAKTIITCREIDSLKAIWPTTDTIRHERNGIKVIKEINYRAGRLYIYWRGVEQ